MSFLQSRSLRFSIMQNRRSRTEGTKRFHACGTCSIEFLFMTCY